MNGYLGTNTSMTQGFMEGTQALKLVCIGFNQDTPVNHGGAVVDFSLFQQQRKMCIIVAVVLSMLIDEDNKPNFMKNSQKIQNKKDEVRGTIHYIK